MASPAPPRSAPPRGLTFFQVASYELTFFTAARTVVSTPARRPRWAGRCCRPLPVAKPLRAEASMVVGCWRGVGRGEGE